MGQKQKFWSDFWGENGWLGAVQLKTQKSENLENQHFLEFQYPWNIKGRPWRSWAYGAGLQPWLGQPMASLETYVRV